MSSSTKKSKSSTSAGGTEKKASKKEKKVGFQAPTGAEVESKATVADTAVESQQAQTEAADNFVVDASTDFEAGVIFSRLDKDGTGVISADAFRQLWREQKDGQFASQLREDDTRLPGMLPHPVIRGMMPPPNEDAAAFEAGKLFSKFDTNNDGRLEKQEFESMIKSYPELRTFNAPMQSMYPDASAVLPVEVITGRLLTHYDESAGVAIPNSAVDQHKSMGNRVLPLIDSYRSRYDRLRSMLTGRLLPRREHLIQLRRQLDNCSTEVAAARKAIEKETFADTEQIIERLRAVESMRQSSIKHQMLQIEEELECIERVIRRVELANQHNLRIGPTGVLVTSATTGSSPLESVSGPRAASMVELIQQFTDLSATIDRLSTKVLTVQVDYPTTDFPKETAERLEIIARCDKYVHALAVKDHMLWVSLQEKERAEEQLQEERQLSHQYAIEVADWADMAQRMAQQMSTLQREKDILERRNQELVNVLRQHNVFYVTKQQPE